MFKLVLTFQDTVLGEYTFDTTPITVGRREDNDVVVDNMAVSGHHAANRGGRAELLRSGRS